MSVLRALNIGTRLGGGFGAILLACGVVTVGTLAATNSLREHLVAAQHQAAEHVSDGHALRAALLGTAVAVRSMGLQAEVAGVQRDQALAQQRQAEYAKVRQRLATAALTEAERAPLARLDALDQQMQTHFKQAVDLLGTFNTEQAAAVITQKIDPLLAQANTEIERFITLQGEGVAQAVAQGQARARQAQLLVGAAGAAVLLLSGLLAWRLTASITGPLREAESAATRMAAGDLGIALHDDGKDEAARLLAAMRHMRDQLATLVARVRDNAESVASASHQIAQGNGDLSARTEQQASALQQTAASMEQLGTAVRHNADNAQQANQLARSAAEVASRGGEQVGQVVATMRGIQDSARRIADIIGVIDGIAFQTNILALNAAVEAARAGEQGRGFAVVASEVRSLAQRSADAAREIKTLIAGSVQRVEDGSSLVDAAGATMTEVVAAIQHVHALVGEISQASGEQSAGVGQVGQAVQAMDRSTQQNAALVEQSAAAAESLRQQADQLVQAVAVFRLQPTAA